MNRVVFAITTCFLVSTAQAYQFEVKGQYGESIDEPRGYEAEQTQASFVWWLDDVSTKDGPLAEAGFLSKSSSLSFSFGRAETEFDVSGMLLPFFGPSIDSQTDRSEARFAWIHRSGWLVAAHAARSEMEQEASLFGDMDGDEYGLTIGYYLTDATTVEASYSLAESDGGSIRPRNPCPLLVDPCSLLQGNRTKVEVDTAALVLKHVASLLNQDFAVSLGYARAELDSTIRSAITTLDPFRVPRSIVVRTSQSAESNVLNVGATWYPTKHLGFELGYARQDADGSSDTDSYRLGTNWFVTENIYLGASVERTEVFLLTGEGDLDSATLKVGVRW